MRLSWPTSGSTTASTKLDAYSASTPASFSISAISQPAPSGLKLARAKDAPGAAHRAAVLVLPQWNSDAGGHIGLCKLLTMHGLTAVRLSLPYHDVRMPPELHRADYIVSEIGRAHV